MKTPLSFSKAAEMIEVAYEEQNPSMVLMTAVQFMETSNASEKEAVINTVIAANCVDAQKKIKFITSNPGERFSGEEVIGNGVVAEFVMNVFCITKEDLKPE